MERPGAARVAGTVYRVARTEFICWVGAKKSNASEKGVFLQIKALDTNDHTPPPPPRTPPPQSPIAHSAHVHASLFSCVPLCNVMDPPGSSVHGILQARILEWVAPIFQGIFPTQGSKLSLLCLLNSQAGSLLLAPPEKTIVPSIFLQALTSPFSFHGNGSTALNPWACSLAWPGIQVGESGQRSLFGRVRNMSSCRPKGGFWNIIFHVPPSYSLLWAHTNKTKGISLFLFLF